MFGDLSKLPEALRNATIASNVAFKRYQKARKQVALWQEEQSNAAHSLTSAQSDHSAMLNRWNPDTNELAPLEDAPLR